MIEALLVAVKHLSAADLARVATTCTELRKAVNFVDTSRRADASDGLESIPVRVGESQDRCVSSDLSLLSPVLAELT